MAEVWCGGWRPLSIALTLWVSTVMSLVTEEDLLLLSGDREIPHCFSRNFMKITCYWGAEEVGTGQDGTCGFYYSLEEVSVLHEEPEEECDITIQNTSPALYVCEHDDVRLFSYLHVFIKDKRTNQILRNRTIQVEMIGIFPNPGNIRVMWDESRDQIHVKWDTPESEFPFHLQYEVQYWSEDSTDKQRKIVLEDELALSQLKPDLRYQLRVRTSWMGENAIWGPWSEVITFNSPGYSVPPTPLEPPRLLERRSRALILAPIHRYSGDGPISSIKLLYKPNGMKSDWHHIIVEQKDNITLPNLKPVTAYQVRYQLSRPGPGGEGPLGPIAVLETDCIEPTVKPEIKSYSKEDRHTISIKWRLPSYSIVGNGFLVRVYHPPNQLFREVNVTSMDILSEKIYGLSSNIEYIFRVFIYHCTSLGPPSDPYYVTLNSKESHPMVPSIESRNPRGSNSGQQLLLAIIGSVSVTCFAIIVALLALFCIKKNVFRRIKMFTYQSGSIQSDAPMLERQTLREANFQPDLPAAYSHVGGQKGLREHGTV